MGSQTMNQFLDGIMSIAIRTTARVVAVVVVVVVSR
jgi:hypothetical protein